MIPINGVAPILGTCDIFDTMKAKFQNEARYYMHFNTLYNTLLEMFIWHDLPDTIPKRFLESLLHSTGEVFIAKINDGIYACTGTLSGEVDAYGMGKDCLAVTPIGEANGKRGIDIAYGINNDTATPDILTYWIAHLMGETDKSIQSNIVYSRFLPIPRVNDMKDKSAFDEIIAKLKDGELQAFASNNILSELEENRADVFEITDVNKSDKIQYLSRLYDNLLKRFFNIYGQPLQTQDKSAQTISDELHGMDSVSFIIPLQMYRCRLALADEVNRIFGTNISVTFSEPWEYEYKAFVLRDVGIEQADEVQSKTAPNSTEQNNTEQDATEQNRTEQDTTEQNNTEQDKGAPSDVVMDDLEETEVTDEPAVMDKGVLDNVDEDV